VAEFGCSVGSRAEACERSPHRFVASLLSGNVAGEKLRGPPIVEPHRMHRWRKMASLFRPSAARTPYSENPYGVRSTEYPYLLTITPCSDIVLPTKEYSLLPTRTSVSIVQFSSSVAQMTWSASLVTQQPFSSFQFSHFPPCSRPRGQRDLGNLKLQTRKMLLGYLDPVRARRSEEYL
jgi:hypothetical protein